ncbi:hypothetical protein [Nocardia beijingensis]|uniref:hypothetical protein n=1 Tax=Nocardia beijingensis TaxID=95162 RepID=UPI00397FB64C
MTTTFQIEPDGEAAFVANCIGGETLIGRAGTAQDMANAALFFASDLSAWITGVGLVVTAAPRRQPRTHRIAHYPKSPKSSTRRDSCTL